MALSCSVHNRTKRAIPGEPDRAPCIWPNRRVNAGSRHEARFSHRFRPLENRPGSRLSDDLGDLPDKVLLLLA